MKQQLPHSREESQWSQCLLLSHSQCYSEAQLIQQPANVLICPQGALFPVFLTAARHMSYMNINRKDHLGRSRHAETHRQHQHPEQEADGEFHQDSRVTLTNIYSHRFHPSRPRRRSDLICPGAESRPHRQKLEFFVALKYDSSNCQ